MTQAKERAAVLEAEFLELTRQHTEQIHEYESRLREATEALNAAREQSAHGIIFAVFLPFSCSFIAFDSLSRFGCTSC